MASKFQFIIAKLFCSYNFVFENTAASLVLVLLLVNDLLNSLVFMFTIY